MEEFGFKPVSMERLVEFKEILKKNKIPVMYRKSLGTGIKAGCGQLG
jgi:adenine C2-methylase RlmN of 23S rRNA A2503 and tRNA A37